MASRCRAPRLLLPLPAAAPLPPLLPPRRATQPAAAACTADGRAVARNYLAGGFAIDFIATLPSLVNLVAIIANFSVRWQPSCAELAFWPALQPRSLPPGGCLVGSC